MLYKFTKVGEVSHEWEMLKNITTDRGTFTFYRGAIDTKKIHIQYHLPFLIQKIYGWDKPIEYATPTVKYVIKPFKDIYMEMGGERICLGRYKRSYIENETYYQLFSCGDRCDLRKNELRTSKTSFKGSVNEGLKVEKIMEKKVCRYEFSIGGECLTRTIDSTEIIFYTFKQHNSGEVGDKEGEEITPDKEEVDFEDPMKKAKISLNKMLEEYQKAMKGYGMDDAHMGEIGESSDEGDYSDEKIDL